MIIAGEKRQTKMSMCIQYSVKLVVPRWCKTWEFWGNTFISVYPLLF